MNPFALSLASGGIVERFWEALLALLQERLLGGAPETVKLLQQAETFFLGPTEDLTVNPAVQDVYYAMRVAGLILLAFCTVISLGEVAEASITGAGGGLVGWFKRFFVATLMTFGGLQFYGLWVRLFNAMLVVFRDYLDKHWTGTDTLGTVYLRMVAQITTGNIVLVGVFAILTLVTLLVLWFLVGGIRKAELILSMVIAPLVWPLYLVSSVEDIPKTALRGFLGLNALLLLTVAMVRLAIRMAILPGETYNLWRLVPAVAMLVMTVFLPATIKRIVGQGHTGVGALMTAVQLAAGLKFLALGVGGGAAAAAAPAAGATAKPQAPSGPSAYPVAPLSSAGATPRPQPEYVRVMPPAALASGPVARAPAGLAEPIPPSESFLDMGESVPGSGRFDTIIAVKRFQQGARHFKTIHPPDGGP